MLRIDMLPAAQGDALWIEYGDAGKPKRILIDGGTSSSWPEGLRMRIETLPKGERHFELLIVTHIDADHIEGEQLTDTLVAQGIPWNEAFAGRAVGVNADGNLPSHKLDDETTLTVLSPSARELAKLKPVWREVVEAAGLDPDKPRQPPEVEEPLAPGL